MMELVLSVLTVSARLIAALMFGSIVFVICLFMGDSIVGNRERHE